MSGDPFDFDPDEPQSRVPTTDEIRAAPASREMPWSEEAEQHVIACCLLDGSETVSRCLEANVTPESFFSAANRLIFEVIVDLYRAKPPVTLETLAEELKTRRLLEGLPGGFVYLIQITGRIPTTAHAGYFIEKVREKHLLRELIKASTATAERCFNFTAGVDELLNETRATFEAAAKVNEVDVESRPLSSFTVPPDDDPSVLLGQRYLNRGDGALLISSSGMGKSSLTLQGAATFALNRPLFGIQPNGKLGGLKSLIIQAEDSDGDVGEVYASIKHGMQLTPEEEKIIAKNVVIVCERVRRGARFLAALRALIRKHKPDLVWINPLLAFMDGDLTDAKEAGQFLREGLNGVNTPATFGYIVVHHTNKPPGAKDRGERKWNEVMYDGAGSADLTNWARAVLSLKATDAEGDFNLVLAKRGKRAGAVTEIDHDGVKHFEVTTTIPLRHARGTVKLPGRDKPLPLILWEPREQVIETKADEPEPAPKKKRSFSMGEFLRAFPGVGDEPSTIPVIRRELAETIGMSPKTFNEARLDALENRLITETSDRRWTRTEAGDLEVNSYLTTKP